MKISVKSFKNIIDQLEIDIQRGKINILIGDNGVGKTNLLRAILHFQETQSDSDVQFTSNFQGSREEEEEIVNRKSVEINYELSDGFINKIIEELKNIKIDSNFIISDNNNRKITLVRNERVKYFESSLRNLIYDKIYNEKLINVNNKYFTVENGIYEPNITAIKSAKSNKSLQNKTVLVPIFDCIINIEKLFEKPIKVIFIDSANNEFDIENNTDIMDFESDNEKKQKLEELLYFIGKKAYEEAENIYKMKSKNSQQVQRNINSVKKIRDLANAKFKQVFDFFNLYAKPDFAIDNTSLSLSVNFDDKAIYGEPANLKSNSAGFKSIFYFIKKFEYALEFSKYNEKVVIIIADELDKNIHPIHQQQLVNYINNRLSNEPESKVFLIISTHSPFLMDFRKETSNFYVAGKREDGSLRVSLANNLIKNDINSSFIAFVKKTLDLHNYIKGLSSDRSVFLQSSQNDDIQILKQKINSPLKNVEYFLIGSDKEINDTFSNVIDNANSLENINQILEANGKVYISREFLNDLRKDDF